MDGLSESIVRAAAAPARRKRIVIVGAGFGGLSAAKRLGAGRRRHHASIDRHNHHLFQPLLYQVATAALSPADIAAPIRAHPRAGSATLDVILGDGHRHRHRAGRAVLLGERRVAYDYLIVATGARTPISATTNGRRSRPGLKTIEDARAMRRAHPGRVRARRGRDDDGRAPAAADVCHRRRRADRRRAGRRARRARARRWPRTSAASIRRRRASCWSKAGDGCCRAFRRDLSAVAAQALDAAWASSCGSAQR